MTNKAVSFSPRKTQFGASEVSTKVELYDFFPQQNDYSRPYAPTGAGRLDDDENDYSKISEHLRVHVAGC